jgi:hypothetical protein
VPFQLYNGGDGGYGISWTGTKFVAAGYSSNGPVYVRVGTSWVPKNGISNSVPNTFQGYDIDGFNDDWVLVGFNYTANTGQIWHTTDGGTSWSLVLSDFIGSSVRYNGSYYLSCGFGLTGIVKSVDGQTWSGIANSFYVPSAVLGYYDLDFNGANWIIVTYTVPHIIKGSSDALTWTAADTGAYNQSSSAAYLGVEWTGAFWLACGINFLLASNTGDSWTNVTPPALQNYQVRGIGSTMITRNTIANSSPFMWSNDGLTWTRSNFPSTVNVSNVYWSGSRFIATVTSATNSDSTPVLYSEDGKNWFFSEGQNLEQSDLTEYPGNALSIIGQNMFYKQQRPADLLARSFYKSGIFF